MSHFTNVFDINQKKIHMGDIVKICKIQNPNSMYQVGDICYITEDKKNIGYVIYNDAIMEYEHIPEVEVIGTINENYELLPR